MKTIHFIRHAEGEHNVAGREDRKNGYLREDLKDAVLSPCGVEQCNQFVDSIQSRANLEKADLVVTSPMRRTLQTAHGCLGKHLNEIPWIAYEHIREQTGLHPCDSRLPTSHHAAAFPNVNFELCEEEDPLIGSYLTRREPNEDVAKRGLLFLDWLCTRSEANIVIVTHSAFLRHFFRQVAEVDNGGEAFVEFANCEMRSFSMCPTRRIFRPMSC